MLAIHQYRALWKQKSALDEKDVNVANVLHLCSAMVEEVFKVAHRHYLTSQPPSSCVASVMKLGGHALTLFASLKRIKGVKNADNLLGEVRSLIFYKTESIVVARVARGVTGCLGGIV